MSHTQHRAAAGSDPIGVCVLVVTSSRTEATDRAGPVIAERLEAAGHRMVSRRIVDDEIGAIRAAVRELAAADAAAVVLTGGTGITGRDVTPEALAPMFAPRIDGFGEQFRALSREEIGAAAMMSRACAGLVGRTVVFALPGSVAAVRLAVDALIGPELAHLVHLARTDREAPAAAATATFGAAAAEVPDEIEVEVEDLPAPASVPEAGPPSAGARVGLVATGAGEPPPEAVAEDGPWRRAIAAWGGTVALDEREPLPEALERLAPAVDLLHRAGALGVLKLPDGRRFGLYGFPDLLRPGSKVLAVGEGGELGHVVAVHRWPVATGTVASSGPTPTEHELPSTVAERLLGRAPPPGEPGMLFAVTGDAIWQLRGRRVHRWDGRTERDDGTPGQALASLLLDWTSR